METVEGKRVMTDWQPIETAPKDGRLFLGAKKFGVDYEWSRYICCWSEFKKSFRSQFGIPEGGIWYPLDEKNTPSHWMPLPEPPILKEKE
jgi:hypothetical protein